MYLCILSCGLFHFFFVLFVLFSCQYYFSRHVAYRHYQVVRCYATVVTLQLLKLNFSLIVTLQLLKLNWQLNGNFEILEQILLVMSQTWQPFRKMILHGNLTTVNVDRYGQARALFNKI